MGKFFKEHGLYLAWVVSLVSLFGSLYLSEVLNLLPCTLCWYQRILAYPLAIILGIAIFRNDRKVFAYAMPLALLGVGVAIYHVVQQELHISLIPQLCTKQPSCVARTGAIFGVVTPPMLSGIAFLSMAFFLWTARPRKENL